MTIAAAPGATAPEQGAERFAEQAAKLRLIDTDVHNDAPLPKLRPYLARKWHLWLEDGGPSFATRGVAHVGSGRMDDAVNEADGLCAGDPAWVVEQLMLKYRIHLGGLGSLPSPAAQRNYR